jgi:YidC/Oxa1 family membrane protein insertase
MERRTIVLVVLLMMVFLFYQPLLRMAGLGQYLEPPRRPVPAAVDTARPDTAASLADAPVTAPPPATTGAAGAAPPPPAQLAPLPSMARTGVIERRWTIETPLYRAEFTNRGARLLAVEFKRYVTAHGVSAKNGRPLRVPAGREVSAGDRVVLAGGPLFGMDLGSGAGLRSLADVVYAVEESTDASGEARALTFIAEDSAGLVIRQAWRVRPDTYALDLEVETRGIPDSWRLNDYSLTMRTWPAFTETDRKTDLNDIRVTSLVGRNLHRDPPLGLVKGPRSYDGMVEWAAVQSRYFLCATVVEQAIPRGVAGRGEEQPLADAETRLLAANEKPVRTVGVGSLIVGLPSSERPLQRFIVYVGPSDLRVLSRLGHDLTRAVDLGWNWMRPISELLLKLLDWIFIVVRNYGLAIFSLAVLVRIVLHPLNTSSLKSMRAMQQLQPEVERLKVKYKSDARAMNTALMALYKENKVNPAGGCLPILLQMPLLMALYQVLLKAIELRQAPFIGWIHDLSAPDTLFSVDYGSGVFPIRLLPVLMAGSGFVLQKFTPANPQQAPMQYMMNAFMLVLFYNLPSGLVFYWTVMNLASAFQQWMVLRRGSSAVVVVAPAGGRKKTA